MGVPCQHCGREYDVTLFEFGRTIWCTCGSRVGLRPVGRFERLAPVRQKGGKVVHAWAFEGNCDPARVRRNTFSLEWPPRSGRIREFPEIDRAEFFSIERARQMINPAQAPWLDELERLCGAASAASRGS